MGPTLFKWLPDVTTLVASPGERNVLGTEANRRRKILVMMNFAVLPLLRTQRDESITGRKASLDIGTMLQTDPQLWDRHGGRDRAVHHHVAGHRKVREGPERLMSSTRQFERKTQHLREGIRSA